MTDYTPEMGADDDITAAVYGCDRIDVVTCDGAAWFVPTTNVAHAFQALETVAATSPTASWYVGYVNGSYHVSTYNRLELLEVTADDTLAKAVSRAALLMALHLKEETTP